MFRLTRKFIAVLMLLWLPLASGSALAASVAMEAHGSCHEMAMSVMQHHDGQAHAASHKQHGASCQDCGVCHLACCGYMAPPSLALAMLQVGDCPATAYSDSYHSVTAAPLDPPPLARS